ncbi:MAG: 2-hydroxyacid dehydrogenase [Gammaproteobacteria bacterium]|nr:2-hydroxyacid dehydrogenase [Gammaproteobacteria bacterium]
MTGDGCVNGVFLDRGSMGGDDVDLSSLTEALPEWRFYEATPADLVLDRIRDADVVVTNKVMLEGSVLERAQRLRLVCVAATGTNNVDLQAAARLGIPVCNVRGYATASVSQHVFALLLALVTRLPEYRDAVQAGRWQKSEQFCLLDYPIVELAGRVMGIIGYGELGRSVARLAEAFGMKVLVAARPGAAAEAGRVPLDDLLRTADIVSLHCPLTPRTRNLIGARELGLMKSDAILINTARGGIVDEGALAEALSRGVIAGAGLDVLSVEPPAAGNPLLARPIPRLLLTPHIAWASREARQRMLDEVGRNIRAFLSGRPRNRVGRTGESLS